MTDMDTAPFETAFKRLSGALQWRGRPGDFDPMRREYFEALKPFPLDQVLIAAQVCRDTLKRFPRIVEWKAAIPKLDTKPADARWMRHAEAVEYVRASRQAFTDDPCSCLACQAAEVTDKPLRYVPEFTVDDREARVWCGLLEKLVTAGHWAHGDELARWYAAHDQFYAVGRSYRRLATVLAFIGADREPGEEG